MFDIVATGRAVAVRVRRGKRGVTALEYALIGSFIAVVIVVSVAAVGTKLVAVFSSFSTSI